MTKGKQLAVTKDGKKPIYSARGVKSAADRQRNMLVQITKNNELGHDENVVA